MEVTIGVERAKGLLLRLELEDGASNRVLGTGAAGALSFALDNGAELVIAGLGKTSSLTLEGLRRAAGQCVRGIAARRVTMVSLELQEIAAVAAACGCTVEATVEAWTEGWLLGGYSFDKYKMPSARFCAVDCLHIIVDDAGGRSNGIAVGEAGIGIDGNGVAGVATAYGDGERVGKCYSVSARKAVERASIRAEAVMLASDWCNEPSNVMTPHRLTEACREHFSSLPGMECNVIEDDALHELGMSGLLTVGMGSSHGPAMIELAYRTKTELPLIALIGKGVTFDMGGMNVKEGKDLSEARYDMGGACAVLGAMHMLAKLGMEANIVALIPTAYNVPDGEAYVPSTVIAYPNGLHVQVGNTDAEGRLILADALLHAQRLGASRIIDIATLTGNVGQALGLGMAGVWGDMEMSLALHELGERNGDRNWTMPLVEDYEELLHSDYADMNNIGSSPYGGAIQAALFLRRFVDKDVCWTHIDMANTVQAKSGRGYTPAGATGYGVRLIADYILSVTEERQR
ncbi:leucyl aminopeptidase family protein [Paenibacillus chungangensis]|uniref:Probable cytosol aminopeptidase n=1 Tax=Paenibacillus chungangensis TaxID=696535 RepID=A0ABW3HKC2_9BACL